MCCFQTTCSKCTPSVEHSTCTGEARSCMHVKKAKVSTFQPKYQGFTQFIQSSCSAKRNPCFLHPRLSLWMPPETSPRLKSMECKWDGMVFGRSPYAWHQGKISTMQSMSHCQWEMQEEREHFLRYLQGIFYELIVFSPRGQSHHFTWLSHILTTIFNMVFRRMKFRAKRTWDPRGGECFA